MDLVANINKNFLYKWGLVCLALLINPYFLFPIILLFSILYFRDKVQSIDLLFIIFLSFLIYGSLERLGSLANFRFIPIAVILFRYILSFNKSERPDSKFLLPLFLFLFYVFLNSLIVSNIQSVSLSNLMQFSFFIIFLYTSVNFKKLSEFKYVFDNIYNLYIVLLSFSIISLLLPEISFARNGTGFQGITLHPNMYGLMMAPFCGLVIVQYIVKKNKRDLVFGIFGIVSLFLSQSRTSILSLFLGFILYILINREFRAYLSRTLILVLFPISLLVMLFYDHIISFFTSFLAKSSIDQNILNSIERSRGSLVEKQLANINENFWWGIGFKIPSNKIISFIEGSKTIAYEKGNFILATLEEVGIVGLLLFFVLMYTLVIKNKNNIIFTILPLVFIFTTAGESTLFSMGGAGFFIWIIFFINRQAQTKFVPSK